VLLVLIGAIISLDSGLEGTLSPFRGAGLGPTLIALALGILALVARPRIALAGFLTLLGLLAAMFVPSGLPGIGPLLDRPFVEMWLFAPLSILAAAGVGSLGARVDHTRVIAVAVLISAALLMHAAGQYDFRPSACCTIATKNDLVAMEWLRQNLTPQERVAIPFARAQIAPARYPALVAATDGAVWIPALAEREVVPLDYETNFGNELTLDQLCDLGVRFIYVGSAARSFDDASINRSPQWFRLRVQLQDVAVYEVSRCAYDG